VFERGKTVHALDLAATLIGGFPHYLQENIGMMIVVQLAISIALLVNRLTV
jgi:hypothetical protein